MKAAELDGDGELDVAYTSWSQDSLFEPEIFRFGVLLNGPDHGSERCCPADLAARITRPIPNGPQGLAGGAIPQPETNLVTLRRLRDEVLSTRPEGQRLAALYAQLTPDVLDVMTDSRPCCTA
jgi:hypothetical protein